MIRIASADAEIEDRFSWEMVRSVATGIVEDCEWGGVAGIGKGGGVDGGGVGDGASGGGGGEGDVGGWEEWDGGWRGDGGLV